MWQGFAGYLSSNAEPILGQMYADAQSHMLLTGFFGEGLADFLDIPDAGQLATASEEYYTISLYGPEVINEATFKYMFGLTYRQLIPSH